MAKRKPLKELPAEFSEHKFECLTESSKVSNFSKEEFEAYQKMYHKEWDHNAMVDGVFEEFAKEIDAKIEERVCERISKEISESKREIARKMKSKNMPVEQIAELTGFSVEEISNL